MDAGGEERMSAVPAAHHLEDFSLDGGTSAWYGPAAKSDAAKESDAAKLDEAFTHGVQQGRAAAIVEYEAKLEEQRQLFATHLSTEREQWAAVVGAELAGRIETGLSKVQAHIAEATARILKPFLAGELHRQAIAELQANVAALLVTDASIRLEVIGPADVLDAMRHCVSDRAANIVFTPGKDCDVRVIAGQTTLETQLKMWLAKLDEAVP
jgi:hypothetical protein